MIESPESSPVFSGPSREFGWVGHGGTYAPLDIPNIFKAAGIDTHWDPETNKIFETGESDRPHAGLDGQQEVFFIFFYNFLLSRTSLPCQPTQAGD